MEEQHQFDDEFETLGGPARGVGLLAGRSRDEPVFLGDGQPSAQATGEPHHAAVGRRLRLPVAIGQLLPRDLEQRLGPLAAIAGLKRQPKRKRVARFGVGIDDGLRAVLGPHDLERPAGEHHVAGDRLAVPADRDGHGAAGLGGRQRVMQAAGIGRGGAADLGDDVAHPKTGTVGRRARAHAADPAALAGHRLDRQVADVSRAIVLIVKTLARQFDPFHGGSPAGERDEHAGGAAGVERTERVMLSRRPRACLLRLRRGARVPIWFADIANRFRRSPARVFRRVQRGGVADLGGLPAAQRFGEEPELQELTRQHDGQRNGDELGVATFHE